MMTQTSTVHICIKHSVNGWFDTHPYQPDPNGTEVEEKIKMMQKARDVCTCSSLIFSRFFSINMLIDNE